MILNVYNNFYLQVKNTELWNGREKKNAVLTQLHKYATKS